MLVQKLITQLKVFWASQLPLLCRNSWIKFEKSWKSDIILHQPDIILHQPDISLSHQNREYLKPIEQELFL